MDRETLEARLADIQSRAAQIESIEDLEARNAAYDAITADLDQHAKDTEAFNAGVAKAEATRSRLSQISVPRPAAKVESRVDENAVSDVRSMANAFVDSPDLADFREERMGRGTKSRMEFPGVEMRALIGSGPVQGAVSSTISGTIAPPTRFPGITQLVEDRPLGLADLTTTIPVSTNAFEYVRDNSSAPYGAAAVVAEGATKPFTTYTFELVPDTVKTVAHLTDISRNALADAPQMQGLLRDRLFYGLKYKVDADLLFGTGSGGSLKGIALADGINTYDVGSSNTEAKVISLRRAKTLTRHNEYVSNVAVLNPDDWESIELSTDTTGAWRVTGNIQENLTPRIWGMSVVETNAMTAGKFLVGDFKLGVTIYDRMAPALYVTDSDGVKFEQNIITLLAELRLGVAVNRPKALALGTFRGAI